METGTQAHAYIDLVFDNGTLRRFVDGRPGEWRPKRIRGTQKAARQQTGRGGRGEFKAAFRGGAAASALELPSTTGGRPT